MYNEQEAKQLLQRAIELDVSQRGLMTRDELVQIASELGVSEAAVDAAITERLEASSVPVEGPPGISDLRMINLGAAAGVAAGLAASPLFAASLPASPGSAVVLSAAVCAGVVMTSGGIALSGRTRSALHFIRRNAALWTGFGAGGLLSVLALDRLGPLTSGTSAPVLQAVLGFTIAGGVITTLVGSVLAAVRRRRHADDGNIAPEGGVVASLTAGSTIA